MNTHLVKIHVIHKTECGENSVGGNEYTRDKEDVNEII
jgi:hypothetical protein